MEQVNALIKEAMGFNSKRGDSLNVVNAAFNEPERESVPEVAWWKEPDTISIAKETGKYLLLVALLGYAFFGVLRPGMRRALEPMNAPELQAIGGPPGSTVSRTSRPRERSRSGCRSAKTCAK